VCNCCNTCNCCSNNSHTFVQVENGNAGNNVQNQAYPSYVAQPMPTIPTAAYNPQAVPSYPPYQTSVPPEKPGELPPYTPTAPEI